MPQISSETCDLPLLVYRVEPRLAIAVILRLQPSRSSKRATTSKCDGDILPSLVFSPAREGETPRGAMFSGSGTRDGLAFLNRADCSPTVEHAEMINESSRDVAHGRMYPSYWRIPLCFSGAAGA